MFSTILLKECPVEKKEWTQIDKSGKILWWSRHSKIHGNKKKLVIAEKCLIIIRDEMQSKEY